MRKQIVVIFFKSVFIFSLIISQAFAMNEQTELEIKTITSISEVLKIVQNIRRLHPNDFIVAALDWDETISHSDGEESIFREEITLRIVEKLVDQLNVNPFILTARYAGTGFDDLEDEALKNFKLAVASVVNRMNNALPILERSTIFQTNGKIRSFKMVDENGTNSVMFQDGIVFAGSSTQTRSIKGKVLTRFLERTPKTVDHLLFLDDNFENILAAQEAFKNHPERHKVTLLYYPHTTKRVLFSVNNLKNIKPEVLRGFTEIEKDKLLDYDNFLTLDQREAIGVR